MTKAEELHLQRTKARDLIVEHDQGDVYTFAIGDKWARGSLKEVLLLEGLLDDARIVETFLSLTWSERFLILAAAKEQGIVEVAKLCPWLPDGQPKEAV